MKNPVVHWQMVRRNPEAAAEFYGRLFEWKVTTANALGYREVDDGSGIGGGIWPARPGAPDLVQLFIGVEDIDACIERAVPLGAQVIVPKTELPDGDAMAILLDPSGVSFGLMRHPSLRS